MFSVYTKWFLYCIVLTDTHRSIFLSNTDVPFLPYWADVEAGHERVCYLGHLRAQVDLFQVDRLRQEVVEQLAEQDAVSQSLSQVAHLKGKLYLLHVALFHVSTYGRASARG